MKRLAAGKPDEVRRTIRALQEQKFVESMGEVPHPDEVAMAKWRRWNPAAGFFHFSTRDVAYSCRRRRLPALTNWTSPPALKTYSDKPSVELPAFDRQGELARVLLERRSWRRFGGKPLTLKHLATLLGLTWAVQQWVHFGGSERLAFKTSPSGGARNSLEVYVLAFDVEGLRAGTYHYEPDSHSLALLSGHTNRSCLEEFLPAQTWFHRPAAAFFITSVFERVQWKYTYPRAYRTILIEAGHLGQTFCLVATSLGLAPFCTAAIGDSAVERHLGIDGVGESVMYVAGVGSRPEGVAWAPSPEGKDDPSTSSPEHERRISGQEQQDE